MRQTKLEVNLSAIKKNAELLKELVDPAMLCCVVKADAYGHGMMQVSEAAIKGGACWLGVALVEEAVELKKYLKERELDASILILSEPRVEDMADVVEHKIRPTLYTEAGLLALSKEVSSRNLAEPFPVHLKVDTGMHRVGESPEIIMTLAKDIMSKPQLELEGVWTHFATANEPSNPYTLEQLKKYDELLGELEAEGWDGSKDSNIRHIANSAASVVLQSDENYKGICYDMVRVGLATYGVIPIIRDGEGEILDIQTDLTPALRLTSEVVFRKQISAGSGLSYGLQHTFEKDSETAVIPIGYADGIRRDYSFVGGEVLIRGSRYRIVGAITMDQIMVECSKEIEVGDEVVLIGKQGKEEITVHEVALKLNTLPYEVMCGIGKRVPRVYVEAEYKK